MSRARFEQLLLERAQARRRPFRLALDIALTVVILGLLALVAARLDRFETRRPQGLAVVNDGDTVTVGGERIRLRGIDAPEYNQSCRKEGADYPCGRQARQALAGLTASQQVICEGWERDRYGRLLAVCKAGERDLNAAMVASGWAVANGAYESEERAARLSRAGLWAGTFDAPRDWRMTHGGMAEGEHDAWQRLLNWLHEIFRFG